MPDAAFIVGNARGAMLLSGMEEIADRLGHALGHVRVPRGYRDTGCHGIQESPSAAVTALEWSPALPHLDGCFGLRLG